MSPRRAAAPSTAPSRSPRGEPDGWLPDGSPLYGEIGLLAVDPDTGRVQCAACGRWFGTIGGAHLTKRHDMTVVQYRETYGLGLRTVLESAARRAQRSASTYERMEREPRLRALLDQGAQDARSGVLTARNRDTIAAGSRRSAQRPERRRLLRELSDRAADRNKAEFEQRLSGRAAALGFPDLTGYLTARHGAGWSTSRISRELGCARLTVIGLLAPFGLPQPLDADHPIEVAALRKVGYPSLADYLRAQPPGSSPTRLAHALGHSVPWLRIRARRDNLDHLLDIPPGAEERATITAHDAGFPDLPSYLQHRYEHDGIGSKSLQTETGLHPLRIAALLTQAGVIRRTDPTHFERQALARAGWDGTLPDYATDRAAAGWTIQRMSSELGRSDVWVARRLRAHGHGHLIQPPGRQRSPAPPPSP